MAESNRIEDLRKRYHENPRRFFAPLANEYRKGGFLDRAILLCEKHLNEQPDNMNGLVVYGQVLFESGKPDEARGPFEAALKVDPENLIALRHLGDIARLGGDLDSAKGWYLKVLEVDRRNDEVLDLLEQLGGAEGASSPEEGRPSVSASSLISVAPNVSVSGGDGDFGMLDLDVPDAPPPPPLPPPPPKPKSADPVKTMVMNVKDLAALANADMRAATTRAEAETVETIAPPPAKTVEIVAPPAATTVEVKATPAPVTLAAPAAPPADTPATKRPSHRTSLLDIDFDFGDLPAEEPPKPMADDERTLIIKAPAAAADTGAVPGLELAEFSAEVSPMAGLESTEFIGGDVGERVEGLDRVELTAADIAPAAAVEGFASTADLGSIEPPPAAVAPPAAQAPSEKTPASAGPAMISFDDLDVSVSADPTPLPTLEPAAESRPKPRMTKSDMSSLPLLADYGLEEDPVAPAPVPAPAPASPPQAEPRRPQPTPTFVTETMAALYIKQGFRHEAIEVYRQLIVQDPADAGLRERLAALERGEDAGADTGADVGADAAPTAVDAAALEFDAPAADAPEPTPAPANTALADVSFAGVGLKTPAAPTPIMTAAVPAGPSAREFFAGFARRGASASAGAGAAPARAAAASTPAPAAAASTPTPTAAASTSAPLPATGWPLDAIFGAPHDVADLHAAEVIAGVGTFDAPSGGTGLDELLGGASAAPKGAAARGVTRASETLKFDQFFAAPGTAAADAPPASPDDATPAAGGDDELNQFQGWLKRIKP